eukprot:7393147-Pyramimonas_sp.AAC.1
MNNDEFVYIHDIQYNDWFRHWIPRTYWGTFATSYVTYNGQRMWDRRFYKNGNAQGVGCKAHRSKA